MLDTYSPLLPNPGYQLQASVPGGLSPRVHSPIQALEAVNRRLRELYPESEDVFDIVLVTNNHAQVGVRLINSINHYGEHEGFGHDMTPTGHPGLGSYLCRVQVNPLEPRAQRGVGKQALSRNKTNPPNPACVALPYPGCKYSHHG